MLNLVEIRRRELNLTQAEFAKLANVHQTLVSHIELGRRAMSVKYAKALDKLSGNKYPWHLWFEDEGGYTVMQPKSK